MLLGLGAVTRRDSPAQQRLFSALSVLIVALVGVMLVSAYMRLALYEMAYGFSRLRTYVHVSLIWLGLLLAVVVVLELLHRERWFASAALMTALGFALDSQCPERGCLHRAAECGPRPAWSGTGCSLPGLSLDGFSPRAGRFLPVCIDAPRDP